MRQLHIARQDLTTARIVDIEPSPLAEGDARLRLDFFALTANNITYAAMGEGDPGYWDFFPAPPGWGRPPAWGFATVVASKAQGVVEGARCYGFFPIGETLDVTPVRAGPRGFIDGAAHRAAKSVVYNHYADTRADPAYVPGFELEQVLFRPLYPSGWWAAERVSQAQPRTVVISSASSKTAMAAAHRLREQGGAERVALTSARHAAHVAASGLYTSVHAYDDLGALSATAPAAYLDFLGRDRVTAEVHRRLGLKLELSVLVGATDWAAKPGGVQVPRQPLEGPAPELLFVPDYAVARIQSNRELGAAMLRDLCRFYAESRAFFTARRETGEAAITAGWSRLAAGDAAPHEGLVLSFV